MYLFSVILLKTVFLEIRSEDVISMYFPPKFEFLNKFLFIVFAIKMLLDETDGLPNLFEFKSNHFNSLFQAEYDFKNPNFGRKYIEIMSSLRISRNAAFR